MNDIATRPIDPGRGSSPSWLKVATGEVSDNP